MQQEKSSGSLLVVTAAIFIVLAGVKMATSIIVPFLLSLFIAIIFSPLFRWLNDRGLPHGLSLFSVLGLIFVLIGIMGLLIGSSVQDFSINIPEYEKNLSAEFSALFDFLQSYGLSMPREELMTILDPKAVMIQVAGTLKSLGSMVTNGLVVLLTVAFLLLESSSFSKKIAQINSNNFHIDEIADKIKHYMALKAIISAATGVVVYLMLVVIGVDYAVLWGIVAFLLNFIPNIGSIIAAVPAVLLAFIQLGPVSAAIAASGYVVINILVGSVIEPKVMGQGLGLSTLIVFLSLIFWGWLLGPVGMLLSIPLTIMVKIALNAEPKTRWIAILLSSSEELKQT